MSKSASTRPLRPLSATLTYAQARDEGLRKQPPKRLPCPASCKIRAQNQWREGRDPSDMWLALTDPSLVLTGAPLLAAFGRYRPDGLTAKAAIRPCTFLSGHDDSRTDTKNLIAGRTTSETNDAERACLHPSRPADLSREQPIAPSSLKSRLAGAMDSSWSGRPGRSSRPRRPTTSRRSPCQSRHTRSVNRHVQPDDHAVRLTGEVPIWLGHVDRLESKFPLRDRRFRVSILRTGPDTRRFGPDESRRVFDRTA